MENVALEKKLLEADKEQTELTFRLSLASKQFKSSLKGTLNSVYQEFNQAVESLDPCPSTPDQIGAILSQVLVRVKKQQELRVREMAAAGTSANSRRSSIASDSGNGSGASLAKEVPEEIVEE